MAPSILVNRSDAMEAPFRLSPYCVFHVDPAGTTVHLVHGLHGSRFSLPLAVWSQVVSLTHAPDATVRFESAPAGVRSAVAELLAEEILVPASTAETDAPEAAFRNRLSPIELAFHSGVDEGGYYAGETDPAHVPEATTPPHERTTAIALPETRLPGEQPLASALVRRRSRRGFGQDPLPLATLSAWLGAVMRTQRVIETPDLGTVSQRNYPSAGARHPLEGYLFVRNVATLEPGAYHYHSLTHTLHRQPSEPAHRDALFALVAKRLGTTPPVVPAMLLVVTAVFARTCWKYRGMPYHAILLETGALYQTASLAACALGLAGCPVGAYPERALAEILRLDRRDEAAVGLFALGVPQTEPVYPAVTACRLLEASPFGSNADTPAVELTSSSGAREILPVAGLGLRTLPDGRLLCAIGADPGEAVVEASVREDLLRLYGKPAA